MSTPPCVCPDPNGPSGCTCSRSQVPRQWLGHPYTGSALFANPSTTAPSPFTFSQFPSTHFRHAPHELNEFHDPRNLHGTQGFTSIQHSLFPQTLYNNSQPPNPIHHYQPPPNAAPPATQGVPSPSPSNRRKHKNNATGRGGAGRKRQRQPASAVAAPTSTICGVGPSTAVPPDNDPPSSSPQLPTINVQPPSDSIPTSTQLPSTSYSSLRANRKPRERSSAATDVWYFCRSSESELKPTNLPSPDQEVVLKRKPRSPFVSCKLCKYVPLFFTFRYGSDTMQGMDCL
jgi:hypothetical protein